VYKSKGHNLAVLLGDVLVKLRADDSKLSSDLNNAKGKVSGFASSISGSLGSVLRGGLERVGQLGTELVVNAARQTVDFVKDSVEAASSLNESTSKVSVVFGESAKEIEEWAKTAASAFGQSRAQALEAAGTFGNLFSALGFGKAEAKDMSIGLTELASDLASFNNIGVDEALIKLRAGIVGETEPLRTLGVNLSAAAVEAYILKNGLAATKAEITESDKVTARYKIILEQTALAQGDFARTSDGYANAQRIFAAEMENLKATVGGALLPVFAKVTTIMANLASAVMPKLATFIETNVTPAIQRLSDGLQNLVDNSTFTWNPEFKQVKLGDLFEFVKSEGLNLTRIKLSDFFDLTLSSEGIEKLTLGDFFDFVKDEGVQINLGDYVNFTYDKSSGGVALTLGDVFSFVSTEKKTTINLQDYIEVVWGDGELKKLTLGDFFDFSDKSGVSIAKFDLKEFFTFSDDTVFPVTQTQLFDFATKVAVAAYSLRDFLAWVTLGSGEGENKIATKDLFDFSGEKEKPTPYGLIDFFSWITGTDIVQITWGDLFNLTLDSTGISKLKLLDFIDVEGVTATELFGGALEELANNLGKAAKAPQWVLDLLAWKPSDGAPAWLKSLTDFAWPDPPVDITSILDWTWPDAPKTISDILSWSWPSFSPALTAAFNAIFNFKWPTIDVPTWLSELTNFTLPVPDWVQALLDWTGVGGGNNSTATSTGSIGGQNNTAPPTNTTNPLGATGPDIVLTPGRSLVYINQVVVNDQQDVETIAYKIAQRLVYG
jgi:hypothetical protein